MSKSEIIKPVFVAFNLPSGGIVKTEPLSEHGDSQPWREGWSMVGVVSAQVSSDYGNDRHIKVMTFGVWQITAQEAVIELGKEVARLTAEKDAETPKRCEADRETYQLKKQVEELTVECESLRRDLLSSVAVRDGLMAEQAAVMDGAKPGKETP